VFAYLTKFLWLFVQPSSLIVLAMMIALWHARRGRLEATRRWLTGAVAAMLILGSSALGDLLMRPLEDRFQRPDLANADIAGLIVIGGAEVARVAASRDVVAVNDAAERYIEAAILARRFPKARVVFAGGGDVFANAGETEALSAARIFLQLGVSRDRLTLEDSSRTTWENAVFSAPLIGQKSGERWLLVTSAWQMPRAVGAFRKAGVTVEAYPVDYRTTQHPSPWRLQTGITDGLRPFDTVLREYPGLLIYWLSGRSSALFPAP
jgi:uncharacterized SAM-binding protein YcdF (DUF218 family)